MLLLLAMACRPDPFVEVEEFGENPGNLQMYERPPATDASPAPLLLVLHGCLQDHRFAEDAGFVDLAPDVLIVAAEQRVTNNPQGCFNWFLPGDTAREGGELASLAAMIQSAQDRHDVDSARVGVVGVSAGGAMANVLLATRPDLLTAGVIVAGAPVGCAESVASAAECLLGSVARADAAWVDEVLQRGAPPWPRVLVVQGEEDLVVAPAVSDVIVAQWAGVHGVSIDGGSVTRFRTARGDATRTIFGQGEVESLRYEGVGHTVPIDVDRGCGRSGPFLDDIDDCLAERAVELLGG